VLPEFPDFPLREVIIAPYPLFCRVEGKVHDKIVANAPDVIASRPKAGAAIWDPKRMLSRLGTLSTPGLLGDCFVGVCLLAMTFFLS